MLKLSLIVGIGGFVGANLRYWASVWFAQRFGPTFPLGTLFVNVVGCYILGLVSAYPVSALSPELRLLIGTGAIGAFTTFSTFGVETLALLQKNAYGLAALNVVANVLVGLAAAWLGNLSARTFN